MRVALVDDSPIIRTGLARLLALAEIEVTAQAGTAQELLAHLGSDPPDHVILDIRMPPTRTDEGLVLAERIRASSPRIGILVLSAYAETAHAVRLLDLAGDEGAGLGLLHKDRIGSIEDLRGALERLEAGEHFVDPYIVDRLWARPEHLAALASLTEREREVLRLMAEGRSNKGISRHLHLAEVTVEAHVGRVFHKLQITGDSHTNKRVLAVIAWLRLRHGP